MPLSIGLITEGRYLSQLQPSGMASALRARGHTVVLIDPEEEAYNIHDDSWLKALDIIVCRGRSAGVLALLRWAQAKGKCVINRVEAISAVLNKAEMAVTFGAHGIPTPLTFIGAKHEILRRGPGSSYPLILKPVFGDNCRDLRVVHSRTELRDLNWQEPIMIAQQFLKSDGYDLKLYGIGTEITAVRKPSCLVRMGMHPFASSTNGEAHVVSLTEEMKALALKCAGLFRLELFGVDCVETGSGLSVVEVNDFPEYTAVPDAGNRLADYVVQQISAAAEPVR